MAKNSGIEFRHDERELKALIARVKSLGPEIEEKIYKKGLRAAGKKMLDTAKGLAPIGRGSAHDKSILSRFTLSIRRSKDGKFIKAFVKNKAPHAHLMEYGFWLTKGKHFQKRIKFVGPHPAQGFMRPALNQNVALTTEEFKQNVEQAIAKLGSKK